MDLATGAIGSLIPKLRELLKEKYKLDEGVKKDVQSLEIELWSLHADLRSMAEVPCDQLDEEVRTWANEARETSYRMEDEVDALLMRVDGSELAGNSDSFRKMMSKLYSKGKTRHQIAELNGQVRQVANRRPEKNKIDRVIADQATTTTTDPWLEDLSKKELVGVNKERDDLIKRLTDVSKKQLNILSIFGFGGLGKTTLANAVYERLEASFDCRAFIWVGRNPDVKKVLKDILSQINKGKCTTSVPTLDERELIHEVRALLEGKRYFIIIDDIWDMNSWDMIRRALVDDNLGSRIILTTRILEFAKNAGDVYELQPLSHDDSKMLVKTSFKGSHEQLAEVTEIILKKCGGIPLAIIIIASLLANRTNKNWPNVYNCSGSEHTDDVEIIKTLLSGYYDLPHYLRTCLLHLSTFPANHVIRKDTLIWKWIAEGFIQIKPEVGLFELGERYFNQLINRSMIQPVEIPHKGIIIGCRIHGIVFDMICSLSRQVNFVTFLDSNEQHTVSLNNACRLAIQSRDDPPLGKDMQRVRSFNAIMCRIGRMPSLKVLRVLAIEDCTFMEGCSNSCLKHIGGLVQLRYLGLRNTPVRELPEEIGNLRFMETLDLRQTSIQELPRSIGLLRRLRCLRANGGYIRVPDWTGMPTSLEELSLDDVSESPDFVTELGKLTELRELRIRIRLLEARSKKDLVESLGRLQKIQVLHLDGASWSEEAGWEGYVPPLGLRQLSLSIKSSRLPAWIDSSFLPHLSHLSVNVEAVEAQDLEILGRFPELLSLTLFVPKVSLDITGGGAFPKLRHFYTSGMPRFGVGAMPSLESVNFNVVLLSSVHMKFDSLTYLPSLENVRVEILYSGVGAIKAKKALELAVDEHPNRPTLDVSNYGASFDECSIIKFSTILPACRLVLSKTSETMSQDARSARRDSQDWYSKLLFDSHDRSYLYVVNELLLSSRQDSQAPHFLRSVVIKNH